MSTKIFMPALSPTMTDGTLHKWFIKVGDKIKPGDVIAEIETDKANMELEAVDKGIITKILVESGTEGVAVNSTIAIIDGDKNEIKSTVNVKNNSEKKDTLSDKIHSKEISNNKDNIINKNNNDKKNIIASPYASSIAHKNRIDLANIKGSGPNGRIIKRDLENIQNNSTIKNLNENIITEPSTIRKIIADKTTETKKNIPHFYLTIESKVDKLLKMRKKINSDYNLKISINDILVKALAHAQKMNPSTNVSWIDNKIVQYKNIDVSIAVALDEGLVTPIVKNADQKGLKEISIEIKELIDKSKKGKLLPEEYNGGTISISNLGMFGITDFSAIINPPQSTILAVGAIRKIPGIIDDEICIINVLKSTLSADHRALDGAQAAKLLKDYNDIVEDPYKLWLLSNDMEIL